VSETPTITNAATADQASRWQTREEKRDQLLAWLTEELTAAGYTVAQSTKHPRAEARWVSKGDVRIGELTVRRIRVYRPRPEGDIVCDGTVEFSPRWGAGEGSYQVNPATGHINLAGLKARLRKLVPQAIVARQQAIESKAREASDERIERDLGEAPAGASYSVYDGKVDFQIHDLPAKRARYIMEMLQAWAAAEKGGAQ
jgi:hypothetical protein